MKCYLRTRHDRHPNPHHGSSVSSSPKLLILHSPSHFPFLTPYRQPKYPDTPTKLPTAVPPVTAKKPALLTPVANAPTTAPPKLQSSTSTWPLFSSSRQLRSAHSMCSRPRMRAASATAVRAVAMMLLRPVVRRITVER